MAVIFDMDGLLVNTEPLWVRAEQAAFARIGRTLTDADCAQTQGLRIDAVVAYWRQRRPWVGPSNDVVVAHILEQMVAQISRLDRPMPGAEQVLSLAGPCALATSSPRTLLEAVLDRFGWHGHFFATCSAEDEIHGKPHPAVYLSAAQALGEAPDSCVALEDSVTGMIAAKAARMRCLVVPDPHQRDRPEWGLADGVFGSLEDIGCHDLGQPAGGVK